MENIPTMLLKFMQAETIFEIYFSKASDKQQGGRCYEINREFQNRSIIVTEMVFKSQKGDACASPHPLCHICKHGLVRS